MEAVKKKSVEALLNPYADRHLLILAALSQAISAEQPLQVSGP